jgi:hypothetical protein
VLQALFGRAPAFFPHLYQPTWVLEGIATYYESRFTTAGRNRGAYHRALLAAAALGDAWPRPSDATFASPKWPGGNRPYAWGGEFFALQGARGDSVVPRFIAKGAGQVWPFRVSRPLEHAGGTGVGEGWRQLKARVTPPPRPAERPQVLVRGLRGLPHARVAPGGDRIVYVHDDGKRDPALRILALATGRTLHTRRVNAQAQPEWVGDTVYVTQLEFQSPVEIRSHLYRWVPGQVWQPLPATGRVRHPFVGPHGRVGTVAIDASDATVRMVRDGGWHELATPEGADAVQRVVSSEAGGRVAAALHRDGRWDVAVWPASQPGAVRWITHDAALDVDPVFTPDGRALLFTSEREGMAQIYAWDVGTGTLQRLTDEPAGAREPAVVAGGDLVYTTLLHDGYAVVRRRALATDAPAIPPAPTPFEPAPTVQLEEGAYDPWPALRPSFWLPYGHDEGGTGRYVGAATAGVDAIGRTRYALFAGAAAQPFRWEALVLARHARWRRFVLDARVSQLWEGIHGGRVGQRERRAEAGLTWRWRRWRSAVTARVSADLVRTTLYDDAADGTPLSQTPTLTGGTLRIEAVHGSRPALAISRENGVRVEALVRRRWGVRDPAWSAELRGAVSAYLALPFPGFAHWVLAARVAGGRTVGPARSLYEIGGTSGEPIELVSGTVVGEQRAFPLRGYPEVGVVSRAAIGALELRIPLWLVGRGLWKTPLVVDRLSVALFGEAGGGWHVGEPPSLPLRDVGAEAVVDLGVLYDVRLRVRGGVGVPLTDGLTVRRGDARAYVTVGTAF